MASLTGDSAENARVLITVMTYPHPSAKYKELVCTAGVTESGDWVRLYPVDYRYRPTSQRFHKYQWIRVNLGPRGAGNDNRKESRHPDLGSITLDGPPIGPDDRWRDRRAIIDRLPVHTVKEWQALHEQDRVSLGVVRPKRVLDLKIEPANAGWKPEWQVLFDQMNLFERPQKPLRKLPYKFSYVFECEDNAKPHTAMIEDWELGVLFLNEAERLGDDKRAADSVRNKFFGEMCRADKDTRFFMGTRFPYNTWLVLGVFWPPRALQERLF
jgi:hypothetical protein